jgi:hypothetical protein
MLASYETATFTVLYRGYDIEVSRAPSGWRASVYPRSAMMSPLTNHQIKALRKLRLWVASSAIPGIHQSTWDKLVELGYVEERREGPGNSRRFLRLTEKGKQAVDEAARQN